MTFRLLIKGDRWRDNLIAIVRVILLALAFVLTGRAHAASGFCPVIEQEAQKNGLPVGFFTRLIWKESGFDPGAISPAGAQGVAQFMPRTASSRGLLNPFKPVEALRESASYLHELLQSFGNVGLAAAAYNAGPGRLARWLTGQDELPSETVDYVLAVTGHTLTEWTTKPIPDLSDEHSCADLVANLKIKSRPASAPFKSQLENPEWKPWGIQLAGNWHLGLLLASFERNSASLSIGHRRGQALYFSQPSARSAGGEFCGTYHEGFAPRGEPILRSTGSYWRRLRGAPQSAAVVGTRQ